MNEVLHTNVFFVITSVAVVVLTTLVIVLLVYGIKIARDAQHISKRIREQTDAISHDIDEARVQAKQFSPLRTIGSVISTFVSSISKSIKKKPSSRKTKVRDDDVAYEESEHAARRGAK